MFLRVGETGSPDLWGTTPALGLGRWDRVRRTCWVYSRFRSLQVPQLSVPHRNAMPVWTSPVRSRSGRLWCWSRRRA